MSRAIVLLADDHEAFLEVNLDSSNRSSKWSRLSATGGRR